jgi:hypothetical protein
MEDECRRVAEALKKSEVHPPPPLHDNMEEARLVAAEELRNARLLNAELVAEVERARERENAAYGEDEELRRAQFF